MTKRDGIIILSIIIVAVFLFFIKGIIVKNEEGKELIIYQDNVQLKELDLKEETDFVIHETNYLSIKDGEADMIKANCRDNLCVKQKAISKKGETIVCLPNKIVVEVK